MRIVEDDLTGVEIAALLTQHLAAMARDSPPQCVHALDSSALRAPDITFWTAWNDTNLMGCGALKELDPDHGEIKSMRTADAFLGQGVGSAMLAHLIDVAVRRSYRRLSLETGSGPAFTPALALYEKFGFEYCGPFANYPDDPFTRFMTMEL
ncbi:MAG: GNAT family N-acetyltransferase [Woeseiaceae bacterium]|nr:GNAT family N-acetyltransferase [Woeseiaceae bacterium]